MDNDSLLSDMKQLLRAELSQTEELLRTEIYQAESRLMKEITDIHTEMTQGFAGTGDPISTLNDQIADHEERLAKVEAKVA